MSDEKNPTCPCGSIMVHVQMMQMCPNPPARYPCFWWCGCGYFLPAADAHDHTCQEGFLEQWRKANEAVAKT